MPTECAWWLDERDAWGWAKSGAAMPPAPALTEADDNDSRPIAGRILGADGNVLRVVRYGSERVKFGFGGNA